MWRGKKYLLAAGFCLICVMLFSACGDSDSDNDSIPTGETDTKNELYQGIAQSSGYDAEDYHYAWGSNPIRYNAPPMVRGEETIHDPYRYDVEVWYFDATVTAQRTEGGETITEEITVKLLYSREDLLSSGNPPVTRITITRTDPDHPWNLETLTDEYYYLVEDQYGKEEYSGETLGEYYGEYYMEAGSTKYKRGQFYGDTAVFDIGFGDSARAYFDGEVYHAAMNYGDEAAELVFTPLCDGWKPGNTNIFHHSNDTDLDLFYQVPIPKASVTGTIRADDDVYTVISGSGYMDHMWGSTHPLFLFRGRYFGRLFADDVTVFWLAEQGRVDGGDVEYLKALLVNRGGNHLLSTESFSLTPGDFVMDSELKREYPQSFVLDFSDEGYDFALHADIVADELVERFDPLEESGLSILWQEIFRQLIAAPGQFRTKGEASLYLRYNQIEYQMQGQAIIDSLFLY